MQALTEARAALKALNEMKAVSITQNVTALPIPQNQNPGPADITPAPQTPDAGMDNSESAGNPDDQSAWAQVDSYLDDLAASVCSFWDCDWNAAQDCLVAAIQGMAQQNLLPPFPLDGATDAEVFAWLAQAKGGGLNRFLNDMCRQMDL